MVLPPATKLGQGNISGVCVKNSGHRGVIPACLAGHMTNQQYISSCTVSGSLLVWRQHTGNIKCMIPPWYPPGQTPPPPNINDGQWAGGTHPTGMHFCFCFFDEPGGLKTCVTLNPRRMLSWPWQIARRQLHKASLRPRIHFLPRYQRHRMIKFWGYANPTNQMF